MSRQGPALPWADPHHQSGQNHVAAPQLVAGDRIQVRWQLEQDNAEPQIKWWGATVLTTGETPSNSVLIRYDQSDGFEAEETQIELISPRALRDMSDPEVALKWKREGAVYDESEVEVTDDEGGATVMSLRELTEEQQELERLTGRSIEDEAMQQLSDNLQPAQQVEVLARFRDFTDHFKGRLQQLMQNDENHVVTSDDIQNIAQGFSQRQGL